MAEEGYELRAAESMNWRKNRAEGLRGPERRHSRGRVELRELSDDGMLHLSGYASVFDVPYENGWYTETVKRGAFRKSLASPGLDVVLNLDHGKSGSGLPIARTTAGTLRLSEDTIGLKVDADLDPDDPDVALLALKRRSGNLDGQMSMAFVTVRDAWDSTYTQRQMIELNLSRGDVSVVVMGASPTTSSDVRSADTGAHLLSLRSWDFRKDRARLEALRYPRQ